MNDARPLQRPDRRLGRAVAWVLFGLLLIVTARAFGWISFRTEEATSSGSDSIPSHAISESMTSESDRGESSKKSERGTTGNVENRLSDDLIRRTIVGTWSRTYSGRWDLEIREDGTGTMTVIPDRLWAIVVGSKITIQMKWDVLDGVAIFDSVSGEPATSFEIVMKMWKKHQERRIVELTESRFVYLSDDGKSNSAWTRVTKEP